VTLVRILDAGMKRAARRLLKIQDAKHRHFGTIAHICPAISSQLRYASIDNRKTTCETSIPLPHVLIIWRNSATAAEIGSGVWGTPVNFNGFCALAALLHGTVVVGVRKTLQR